MGLTTSGATSSGGTAQARRRRGNIFCEVRDESVQDGERAPSGNRASVYEAANILGITVDAIRKRVQRGTIRHERDDYGRVWVLLDSSSTILDDVQDNYRATSGELVDELREQVRYLREILSKEQEARRRADSIIAQLTQANASPTPHVLELKAPPGGSTPPPPPPAAAQGDSERREESRWRKLFQV